MDPGAASGAVGEGLEEGGGRAKWLWLWCLRETFGCAV
jgi:hypothetical protein